MISNYAPFGILSQHKALLIWILVGFMDSSIDLIDHVNRQFVLSYVVRSKYDQRLWQMIIVYGAGSNFISYLSCMIE
jgi:hypothetical protein